MKTTDEFKKFISELTLGIFLVTSLNPIPAFSRDNSNGEVIYPLKEISELNCRYQDFKDLSGNCKQKLPILKTKDYKKYARKDGGYNEYTRIYTVLWGSSYEYGWDVGNGGHTGIDIATSKGTPVYAIADGKVIQAKEFVSRGNTVSIEHIINGKTVISNYSHLSKIRAKVGDKVKVGKKIGEVGSTGNSTGNHLHFQIDMKSRSHPNYYNYKTCSYSYYKIIESGVCFDQLEQFTIDPLLFLETKGAILNNIKTKSNTVKNNNNTTNTNKDDNNILNIFNTTVYTGYNESDIEKVQKVFDELGYYNGKISGDYSDVIDEVIKYQIDKNIIKSKNSDGAGRFGPKTRNQAQKDYLLAIGDSKDNTLTSNSNEEETIIKNTTETVKISRHNLLTREEIEAREVKEFLKDYNIDLEFKEAGSNIEKGKNITLKLKITDKRGRAFRGNMPSGMTFIIDESKVTVFPQKLYYFTDGKRDIKLTGLKTGNTTLYVKIGNQTIKIFPIKIYSSKNNIEANKANILGLNNIVIGDKKTGIIIFQDKENANLVNLEYNGNFQLKTNADAKICVKQGNISNIKNIYYNKCSNDEFQDYKNITYKESVGGLIIFDYKATGKNPKIELINKNNNTNLATKNILVANPKGLSANYEYTDQIVDLLEKGLIDGINKGYFQEKNELKEYDALSWIRNTLIDMNNNKEYYPKKAIIEKNLKAVYTLRENSSRFNTINREKLLNLTYEFLILEPDDPTIMIKYKDLSNNTNKIANLIFNQNNTWKDKFGKNYFRPNIKITRGEGAYMLSQVIQKNTQILLTLK